MEFPERHTLSPGVAAMLAAARKAHGWSIRQAARQVGCSPGSIVHWEQGRRAPSTYYAGQIIDAYELDDDDADRVQAEAVPGAGMSSPWRDGKPRRTRSVW